MCIRDRDKQELITALADGGIEQKLQTLNGVRSTAVLEKLVTVEGAVSYTHLDVYKRQALRTGRNS